METTKRSTTGYQALMKFMGVLMALLYLFLGTFMIFYGPESFNLPSAYAITFGVMLFVYGIFRGYRLIHQLYLKKDES